MGGAGRRGKEQVVRSGSSSVVTAGDALRAAIRVRENESTSPEDSGYDTPPRQGAEDGVQNGSGAAGGGVVGSDGGNGGGGVHISQPPSKSRSSGQGVEDDHVRGEPNRSSETIAASAVRQNQPATTARPTRGNPVHTREEVIRSRWSGSESLADESGPTNTSRRSEDGSLEKEHRATRTRSGSIVDNEDLLVRDTGGFGGGIVWVCSEWEVPTHSFEWATIHCLTTNY